MSQKNSYSPEQAIEESTHNGIALRARRMPSSDADISARIVALTDFVHRVGAAYGQYLEPHQTQVEMTSHYEKFREHALMAAFQAIERLAQES